MNYWKQLPSQEKLFSMKGPVKEAFPQVNAHLHTPYSFTAFESIGQAFEMALKEDVKVMGINDFYSMDGYGDWAAEATRKNVFPLFNIEFVGLSQAEQRKGIRINDPNNPGRIYISGKGLQFPVTLQDPHRSKLLRVRQNANAQVEEMCGALNAHLERVGIPVRFSFPALMQTYSKGNVRERHLAKALRVEIFQRFSSDEARMANLQKIFGGKPVKSSLGDHAALENEIRSNLLKAGGPAFIPEDPSHFLSLEEIRELILAAGGIPTYPLLADSVNGGYTEFEQDKEKLLETLQGKGIFSIEFIPNRNTMQALEEYAQFFSDNGFLVTMGSEHNTPELLPIRLFDKRGSHLSDVLAKINFEGASIVAAHQYLTARGETGFLDHDGMAVMDSREDLIQLGTALIHYFTTNANETIRV